MLFNEYQSHVLKIKPADSKAKIILFKLLDDLLDRGGLDDAFESIDPSTQEDILQAWHKIIQKELDRE